MSDEFATEMQQLFGDRMAWAMGPPEPDRDWHQSTATKFVQKKDPTTGLLGWLMIVADPSSRTQRRVKILCDDEPVIPEPAGEWPFIAVEFVGLTVRPWLNDRGCKPQPGRRCGCRVELSIRARGVRAVDVARPTPAPTPEKRAGQNDAA
jgi:hypothetical protein